VLKFSKIKERSSIQKELVKMVKLRKKKELINTNIMTVVLDQKVEVVGVVVEKLKVMPNGNNNHWVLEQP